MSTISRRSLAKGAAWAAPVIAATTTIPAYAASATQCLPSIIPTGFPRMILDAGATQVGEKSPQYISFSFGGVYLEGIPRGVFVKSINTSIFIQRRINIDFQEEGIVSPVTFPETKIKLTAEETPETFSGSVKKWKFH